MHFKRVLALILLVAITLMAPIALFMALVPVQAAAEQETAVLTDLPPAQKILGNSPTTFVAFLSGDEEVPPVSTDASGIARFTLVSSDTLNFEVAVRDIISITAAHIHLGAPGVNGGVVFTLFDGMGNFDPDNPISGTLMLTAPQLNDLLAGNYYVNVHTMANAGGEVRGQVFAAETQAFWTPLSGANEVGPVDSQATGTAYLTLSPDMSQLYYRLLVNDIEDITAAHIHEAPAGQNGGVISTLYAGGGDFDTENPVSGVLSPTLAQVTALVAGDYYVNVHTTANPSGEVRGQLANYDPRSDYHALLTGDEEVPPVTTTAVGVAQLSLSPDLASLDFDVSVNDITDITAAHIHTGQLGQNGGVAHTLYAGSGSFGPGDPISGTLSLGAQDVLDLVSGFYYINVHTTGNPGGEIRGQVGGASVFSAALNGTQEVPPVSTGASGTAVFALSDDTTELHYRVMVSNVPTITSAHIHVGAPGVNGPVEFTLFDGTGTFDEDNPISGMLALTETHIFDLLAGNYYVNIHTTDTPSGEIRGQVGRQTPSTDYQAMLAGDQEVPPVTTTASGTGDFTLDNGRNVLHYQIAVTDILSITSAHIHSGRVGENGPVVFTLFSGMGTFDPSNPIGSGVELNAPNLVDLLTGHYYVNVHTTDNPSGEIRGQIDAVTYITYMPIIFKN